MAHDTNNGADETDGDAGVVDERASDDHASTSSMGSDGKTNPGKAGARPEGQTGGNSRDTGSTDPMTDRGRGGQGNGPSHADQADQAQRAASRHPSQEPYVSLTIEGEYDDVFERIDHPQEFQHTELDQIMDNVESTLVAVVGTGGGIRSEIYEEVDFELDDPWELRKYLEVLEMHDLIRLRDDQWVPSDYFERTDAESE